MWINHNFGFFSSKITDATRYDVSIFDDGSKLVSKSTAGLSVPIINLSPGKTYLVTIVTGRNVAIDGKDVEFLGGVFSDNMESGKIPFNFLCTSHCTELPPFQCLDCGILT